MSETLSVEIKTSVRWLLEESLDLSTLVDSSKLEASISLADGAGVNQANQIWHDVRSVASEEHDDLDLTALSQTIRGNSVTIAFGSIKAILVYNTAIETGEDLSLDSSVTSSILTPFGGSATSKVQIPADSPLLLVNRRGGWAVTPDSADVLRISNLGDEAIEYKIVIVGTAS